MLQAQRRKEQQQHKQTAQEPAAPPHSAAGSWEKLPTSHRKCVETQHLQSGLGKIEINLVERISDLAEGRAPKQRDQGGDQDAGVAGCAAEGAAALGSGLSPAWSPAGLE